MAKPIRKTPTLTGKTADKFLETMIKTQRRKKATKAEEKLIELVSR